MLINKVEKTRIYLDSKNIKKYKRTCREFNIKYNSILPELLVEKYSLPTRKEWDILISEINKLRKEIKTLKSNKKTQEELFQESLRIFRESQGEFVNTAEEDNKELDLKNKENKLKILIKYKDTLHKLANNSNITITTIRSLLGSCTFDLALKSYFERILITSINRFKAKPKK